MQVFDFTAGTKVYCEDGECGTLAKVVVDPNTLELKQIVVESGERLQKARIFPIWAVTSTSDNKIHMAVSKAELRNYPEYEGSTYDSLHQNSAPSTIEETGSTGKEPFTDHTEAFFVYEKAPPSMVDKLSGLSHGTRVYTQDSEAGRLDSFLTDPEQNEAITHLIIRQGFLVTEFIPVPVSLIQQIDQAGIHLATTKEGLVGLTRYAWPDEVGYDQGNSNDRSLPNSGKILSHDLALRAIVANALSENPQTKEAVIEVVNEQGIITLIGTVISEKVRRAAHAIALQQPGVISVIDSLKVRSSGDAGNSSSNNSERQRIEPLIHPYAMEH